MWQPREAVAVVKAPPVVMRSAAAKLSPVEHRAACDNVIRLVAKEDLPQAAFAAEGVALPADALDRNLGLGNLVEAHRFTTVVGCATLTILLAIWTASGSDTETRVAIEAKRSGTGP